MTEGEATAEMAGNDIRPVVARATSNRGVWIFSAVAAMGAVGLFTALDARRTAVSAPTIFAPGGPSGETFAAPPELVIPQDYGQNSLQQNSLVPEASPANALRNPAIQTAPQPQRPLAPYGPIAAPYPPPGPAAAPGPAAPAGPGFAYQAPSRKLAPDPANAAGARSGDERANASKLLNPATTVPQGTVIQAVMETALDSNRAGYARAVVSRDVMSFDGSHVLIPKGSKLFGEYKSDLSAGQNRALIQWHRLTRPDGGIIDVDSPSADPLGRAGVKGKVNSHFLARFGGAILQSALDIGTQLATRSITGDTYILNVPIQNAREAVSSTTRVQEVRPTLTVKQGTSVSVFVVRDLDFTSVEQ